MMGLFDVSLDVMRLIISFQCPFTLCSLEATCHLFNSLDSPYHALFESAWQAICVRRWNLVNQKERDFVLKVIAAQVGLFILTYKVI